MLSLLSDDHLQAQRQIILSLLLAHQKISQQQFEQWQSMVVTQAGAVAHETTAHLVIEKFVMGDDVNEKIDQKNVGIQSEGSSSNTLANSPIIVGPARVDSISYQLGPVNNRDDVVEELRKIRTQVAELGDQDQSLETKTSAAFTQLSAAIEEAKSPQSVL
jgi:hypothetical protein